MKDTKSVITPAFLVQEETDLEAAGPAASTRLYQKTM